MSTGYPSQTLKKRLLQISEGIFRAKFRVNFAGALLGTKKHGNGNVQANVRANNSEQFEGTAHENAGF